MKVIPEDVKMTPMLEQYSYWKERYPECLLFFRMGDFFEMFFRDAEEASKVLDITLTAPGFGKEDSHGGGSPAMRRKIT